MSEDEGSNMLNQAMMFALMREHTKHDKKLADARNARTSFRKTIKSYGVNLKNFDIAFHVATASDEGDTYIENLREQQRLMRLANVHVGHQFSFEDEFDAAENVEGTKAYQLGARAYIDGAEESDCPHAANTTEGQEWMKGWRYSLDLCSEGLEALKALDAGEDPDAPDAAEGTIPAKPTGKNANSSSEEAGATA